MKKKIISLFSGAGGMDLGFIKAGFEICFANDIDSNAVKTYKKNIGGHIIEGNISEMFMNNYEIEKYQKIDVIIVGPPCQGFSIAGKIARSFKDDERNSLYKEFIRVVDVIKPKIVVMENVANLYTYKKGKIKYGKCKSSLNNRIFNVNICYSINNMYNNVFTSTCNIRFCDI